MRQSPLSKALAEHGIAEGSIASCLLGILIPALSWKPKRAYMIFIVFIFAAAVMSFLGLFSGLVDIRSEGAVLVHLAHFSQYRFSPKLSSRLKDNTSSIPIQISEIEFKGGTGIASLSGVVIKNPGGLNPKGEGPENLIDGNRSTTWVDFRRAPLVIVFPKAVALTSFRFVTANNSADRDPTRWKLEGSNGKGWTLLHTQSEDYDTSFGRSTESQWFDWFDFDEPHWGLHLKDWNGHGEVALAQFPYKGPLFSQCRFTPTKLRREDAAGIQMSEIEFRIGDAVVRLPKGVANDEVRADMLGWSSGHEEGPGKAIDGDTKTKFFDAGKGPLTITWKRPQRLSAFRFVTANDYSGRDPIQWTLHCSSDQSTWALSHQQGTDYPTPIVRRTPTEWFALDLDAKVAKRDFLAARYESFQADDHNYNYSGNYSYNDHGYYPGSTDDISDTEYCFTPTKLRSDESGVVEISEIEFKNGDTHVTLPEISHAQTIGSSSVESRGGAAMHAIDGDNSTDWVSMHPATICIVPQTAINMTSFRFKTGNRFAGRDPIQWTLTRRSNIEYFGNGSMGFKSTVLHAQTIDYITSIDNAPPLRQSPTEWFDIDLAAVPFDVVDNEPNYQDQEDGDDQDF